MSLSNTKLKILNAAEKLVSEQSISGTTIAEIARNANVSDSHIYQYFKNKEDLLFAIAYRRTKEVYEQLGEQLDGIYDISSKLSRLIWQSLNYNDQNSGYFRILFDCFAKKNFYDTKACHQGKKIADVILYILQEGVNNGVFRSDVNLRIVQLIIIGTIDTESVSRIMLNEIDATVNDFDNIMDLIYPMILKKPPVRKIPKRELVINAAKKVLSQKSYEKAKLSEIAKEAGIGEKSLYYYFKDKEDIVFSISEDKFNSGTNFFKDHLEVNTSKQKLKRFLENHFWMVAGDPDFCKVFISEIQSDKRIYKSEHYKNYEDYYKQLENILEQGIEDGSFKNNLNPRVYRNMFLGAFTRIAMRWVIFGDKQSFDRFSEASQCVQLFLKSAKK